MNKGVLTLIPLFFLFCNYPYKFLLREFQVEDPNLAEYSSIFLYSNQENNCFEYEIIINTPLISPFLPSFEMQYFDFNNINQLIQNQFLWIRVYLKNKLNQTLLIDLNKFYIKHFDKVNSQITISELIIQNPMYLNDIPIFWYAIPKEPILYLLPKTDWLKNFYYKPFTLEDREYKIKHYQNFYNSYSKTKLQPQKETLFFLIFNHLMEPDRTYTLVYDDSQCLIQIPFVYKINIKEEPINIYEEENLIRNIINKIEKRNIIWQDELKEQLKKHEFKEFKKSKIF